MATVEQIVSRALRLIRVLDPNMPVKPRDMETGIEALNGMMTKWESFPLPMGWANVSNPSDTMPIPDESHESVSANLAMTLAPEYGVLADQNVVVMASTGLDLLRRQYGAATPMFLYDSTPWGNGFRGYFPWWHY